MKKQKTDKKVVLLGSVTVLALVFIGFGLSSFSSFVQSTPKSPAAVLYASTSVGGRIQARTDLSMYEYPETGSALIGSRPMNAIGTVTNGPVTERRVTYPAGCQAASVAALGRTCTPKTTYVSWTRVDFDRSIEGWVKTTQIMPAISTTFTGDSLVFTTHDTNVRSAPNGTIVQTVPTGAKGIIGGSPVSSGGYIWWPVEYADGSSGWSAESNLATPERQLMVNIPDVVAVPETDPTLNSIVSPSEWKSIPVFGSGTQVASALDASNEVFLFDMPSNDPTKDAVLALKSVGNQAIQVSVYDPLSPTIPASELAPVGYTRSDGSVVLDFGADFYRTGDEGGDLVPLFEGAIGSIEIRSEQPGEQEVIIIYYGPNSAWANVRAGMIEEAEKMNALPEWQLENDTTGPDFGLINEGGIDNIGGGGRDGGVLEYVHNY